MSGRYSTLYTSPYYMTDDNGLQYKIVSWLGNTPQTAILSGAGGARPTIVKLTHNVTVSSTEHPYGLPVYVTGVAPMAFQYVQNIEEVIFLDDIGKDVGGCAFSHLPNLKSVQIHNFSSNTGNTGIYIFSSCPKLETVTIFNPTSIIGNGMFDGCINLHTIRIPRSVKAIYGCAFDNCYSITDVYYEGDATDRQKIQVGSYNKPLFKSSVKWHYNQSWDDINENPETRLRSHRVWKIR